MDETPPKITLCHTSPIEVTGNQESNLTLVDWVEPSATDENGLPLSVTSNLLPGIPLPIGTTTVTYSFTDTYGNDDSCTFDVIVHGECSLRSCLSFVLNLDCVTPYLSYGPHNKAFKPFLIFFISCDVIWHPFDSLFANQLCESVCK